MNINNDEQENLDPILDDSGQYCLCPACGYYELIPMSNCPRCHQNINWDWYERLKIRK